MDFLLLLPSWYVYLLVTVLGLIVGSFLNVVIYRFHTGKSLNGNSHCLSCGGKLRWYELFPVVSYLALRGRCRQCGSFIPVRYVLVEMLTAGLFLLAFIVTPLTWALLIWWALIAVLVVVLMYDLYHLIIPDELVLVLCVLAVVLFLVEVPSSLYGQGVFLSISAAVGAFLFYGGLWFVSKGRWIGFGDAKLAIPLAFIIGPVDTFSFVVLSFWVGALVSGVLLGVQSLLKRGQHRLSKYGLAITMKSEVPFAPFIIAAFVLVSLLHIDILVYTEQFLSVL